MKGKGNDGKGNIPEKDEWETLKWLFEVLDKQYKFNFDCCANEHNAKTEDYCDSFLDVPTDIINNKVCWMNPPFSKATEMFKHFFKVIERGVAIYRCDNMETRIWQQIIFPNTSWIFIPNKRIAYEGMEGNTSRFPSALIGLNVEPPRELKGVILKPLKFHN